MKELIVRFFFNNRRFRVHTICILKIEIVFETGWIKY